MSYVLAIDVGGTFTDLLLADQRDGSHAIAKTPTTPADPA
ncbi:MAG: hydantoinase/oxoprolinase N-terminal domain-containing protein [Gaiellaceae bacterium]